MDIAVKEEAGKTMEEKFQLETMKRQAKAQGRDPSLVRGVGHMKQNLRPNMRSNPFIGPYSPGKPAHSTIRIC